MARFLPSVLRMPIHRPTPLRPGPTRTALGIGARRAVLAATLLAVPLIPAALMPAAWAQDAPSASAPAPGGQPDARNGGRHGRFAERFAAADANHDGHLTLAEAQAARMRGIVRDFDAIDTGHQGYVTLDEIRAFHRARHAARTSPDAQSPAQPDPAPQNGEAS